MADTKFGGTVESDGFHIGDAQLIESELEQLDGVTAGTAAASKAVVLDSNKDVSGLRNVSATAVVVGSGTHKCVKTTVDASGGGSATETAIATVPEDSLILDVTAKVTAAFDGDATTTCEVGLNGNTDKYVDTVDFDASTANTTLSMHGGTNNDQADPVFVSSDEAIVATWTNTASASAGTVEVIVTYIEYDLTADV